MARPIFINYRSADSDSSGALLYLELCHRFGQDSVFIDFGSIPAGADYAHELLANVRAATVVLAIVGPRWLRPDPATNRRALDSPTDWVRRELAAAFEASVRVVPILTDDATMPAENELPADIARFARCQYRLLRRREPATDIAHLAAELATFDPRLAAADQRQTGTPQQLPADRDTFSGRDKELAELTAAGQGRTVVLSGLGGVGKTSLAVHWAHQHRSEFPDGQLFVDLNGFVATAGPMPPGAAIRSFLDALGVAAASIPVQSDAQIALYRRLITGRRMLIVLDNAGDSHQVRPLLPDDTAATVLITSRDRLLDLVAGRDARTILVDPLDEEHAWDVVARRIGAARLVAEPEAAAEIIRACAGLPIALAISAARVAEYPQFPLASLARDLRESSGRVAALNVGGDTGNLTAVLACSYTRLAPQPARLFRLLGVHPGRDADIGVVACLAGTPVDSVRPVLRQLELVSLVHQPVATRYRMHDLIRLYAAGLTESGERDYALDRLIDYYLGSAYAGDRLLEPLREPLTLEESTTRSTTHPLHDVASALAWFDLEHATLLAVQRVAHQAGRHRAVWQLAWALTTFHRRRGHYHDEVATWLRALAATTRVADTDAEILARRRLGFAYARVARFDEAVDEFELALGLAERQGDSAAAAHVEFGLARAWEQRRDPRRALTYARLALRHYRTTGDAIGQAAALNAIGWYHALLGDPARGRARCRAALVLDQRHRHRDGEADALDSLGYIDRVSGRLEQALSHYERALALRRAAGNSAEEAWVIEQIGTVQRERGQTGLARHAWQHAAMLYAGQSRTTDADRVHTLLADLAPVSTPD